MVEVVKKIPSTLNIFIKNPLSMGEIKNFTGKVLSKRFLNKEIMLFSLSAPKRFSFQAGQFVTFKIIKDQESKLRSYSILNPPSAKKSQLDFCIKIIEGGFASSVFKEMNLGDDFEIKGPFGHLLLDHTGKNKEHWFICVGVGVVPFHSILREHLERNPQHKFKLLFSAKTKEDLIFYEEFQELEKKYPHFEYLATLTREEWSGPQGRVQKHLTGDLQNKTFYICGLKEMVLETKEFLLNKSVKAENIHLERYN